MTAAKMKIKKGDTVTVITGTSKGSQGEVLKVDLEKNRVLVQGVNMRTHHVKPSQESAGGITKKEAYIHASNVALLDPKENKATRVGYKTLENGTKVRIARRSGDTLD